MDPYYRQNDREAITYLKASYRCLTKERTVKYFVIFASFLVCLLGIFNKYLPVMFAWVGNIAAIQSQLSVYINLLSGAVLIVSILMSFYTHRMHMEGVCFQERYECYLFDFPLNQSIMRPVSQTMIEVYASKIKRKTERFKNLYYGSPEDVDDKTGHFDNINRQFHSDYRMYISVQPFFMTIWIGFIIVVVLLAVSFDDNFILTLINIIFPSLSAINIIAGSWFAFRQQIRQMTNAINVIDGIQRLPDKERNEKMRDPMTLRMLQDGLFNYRVSAFVIPNFLVRRHEKQMAKESWGSGERRSSDLIRVINDNKTRDLQIRKTREREARAQTRSASVAGKTAATTRSSPKPRSKSVSRSGDRARTKEEPLRLDAVNETVILEERKKK